MGGFQTSLMSLTANPEYIMVRLKPESLNDIRLESAYRCLPGVPAFMRNYERLTSASARSTCSA